MKRIGIAVALLVCLTLLADWATAYSQARTVQQRLGNDDILAAFSRKVHPGMKRPEVESVLQGYRSRDAEERDGELTVRYGYWFGFLPPLSSVQIKYLGEVVVTYSKEGRVLDSSYWLN